MRGYKLGAVDYVMVPVIPEILRTKVEVLASCSASGANCNWPTNASRGQRGPARREGARTRTCSTNRCAWPTRTGAAQRRPAVAGRRTRAREAQLRELDRRKDEFLATLAHELRNPLAPLRNALNIRKLAGSEDPLQGMMERQLDLLVRLIDDLLDVARINRGKLVLRPARPRCRTMLQCRDGNSVIVAGERHAPAAGAMPDESLPMLADPHGCRRCSPTCSATRRSIPIPARRIEVSVQPTTMA
jgi:signal transduction histidine kinase